MLGPVGKITLQSPTAWNLMLAGREANPELRGCPGSECPERQALEALFVKRLGSSLSTAVVALRPVVLRLVELGATRKELMAIAQAHEYKKAYVSSLLSEILVGRGQRSRQSGAGPKTPPLALIIKAFAREKAGRSAYRMLRAATHAAWKEDQAEAATRHAPGDLWQLPYLI